MTWNFELPTRQLSSPQGKRSLQGQDRIKELLVFSQSHFAASAVNFAWLERSNRCLWVGGHIGLHQRYYDEYKTKLLPADPLGLEVMIGNREKIFCLSRLHDSLARRGAELLQPYGFRDELNLVLHNHDEPVAILTVFGSTPFQEELHRLKPTQRFLELFIDNHPYVRAQACHRLLRSRYNLTEREIQVVEHILEGASNADIAEMLNIALATVKTHVVRVLDKTSTHTRSELIALLKEW